MRSTRIKLHNKKKYVRVTIQLHTISGFIITIKTKKSTIHESGIETHHMICIKLFFHQ